MPRTSPTNESYNINLNRVQRKLETHAYLREVFRDQGKIGIGVRLECDLVRSISVSPDQRSNDPILASMIAPTTTAMVDFVTTTVGWNVNARYNALAHDVNRLWDGGAAASTVG
jgi:carboxypeptidase C (cathepsin A)